MTTRFRACAAVAASVLGSTASAALTVSFRQNAIAPAAIVADPGLAGMQSWSIVVTNTDGHWASAGLRMTLPAGNVFYQTPPARAGGDTHSNPLLFAVFPELEFDTYVSSPRNQQGMNPPAILGPYPEADPPQSFGGATDAVPGRFSVSWGDPQATSGPGPGTYEITRMTFPNTVLPTIEPTSQTSQVLPDMTVLINAQIPEPGSMSLLMLVLAAGASTRARRSSS